jgi:hypothetical protein
LRPRCGDIAGPARGARASSHDQPSIPRLAQRAKSAGRGRIATAASTAEPITRPCGTASRAGFQQQHTAAGLGAEARRQALPTKNSSPS